MLESKSLLCVALLLLLHFSLPQGTEARAAKPLCGDRTSKQSIRLLTPKKPPRNCVYHIQAYSKKVCQLRLDIAYTLSPPSVPTNRNEITYAQCETDYLKVGDLRLCGIETNNHIYVPFNRSAGVKQVDIALVLADRSGGNMLRVPSWDIKVTQLECLTGTAYNGDLLDEVAPAMQNLTEISASEAVFAANEGFYLAPTGCLQYFPEDKGVITSFNYDLSKGIYPGNMNYAICFRRQAKTKGLQLEGWVFNLETRSFLSKDQQLDSYCQQEDSLAVPQATLVNSNVQANLFCGSILQGETLETTYAGPLSLNFNSNKFYNQRQAGFYLKYKLL